MPDFRMTIGVDSGQLAGVSAAFARFAEAHALPPAVRRSVGIALDELLNNAVSYGSAGEVRIEAELKADRLCVTLSDNGKPFNPLAMSAPDTARSLEERQVGGLGIHLTRKMMDEVAYHRRGDRNVVSLAKLLPKDGT